jgi:excisionase family DNA binding protein
MTRKLITPKRFSKQTGLDYQTVLDYVKAGEIFSVRVGKRHRIPAEWVDRWLRGTTMDQVSPTADEIMSAISDAIAVKEAAA